MQRAGQPSKRHEAGLCSGRRAGDTLRRCGVGPLVPGAGLGGFAGSKIGGGKGHLAAVAVGTLAGAFIGRGIGQSLDNIDKLYAERAKSSAAAAPVGQTIAWNNPDSGNSGTVTAVRDGTNTRTGAYCREYRTTVDVGGKPEAAYGTSCRQPDGSWRISN